MSKVYCINCAYFRQPEYFQDYCAAPTGEIIKDYIYGDHKELIDLYPRSDNYPNKRDTNGCTYYKRKWWKFWVWEQLQTI